MNGNDFLEFGNGNGNGLLHSKSLGTRANTNPFPQFGNGNLRVSFQGMAGNGNGGKKYNVKV